MLPLLTPEQEELVEEKPTPRFPVLITVTFEVELQPLISVAKTV
jgi:hypothetical protein